MFSYPIIPDNSEAQHSSISIYIPSAGRSFMLEFLLWSSKKHLVRCFPKPPVFWSSAVRTSFSRRDRRFGWPWGAISSFSRIMDHDPICWMLWHHDGFFQTTAGFRSDQGRYASNNLSSFALIGRLCLLLCLCIILSWNPNKYRDSPYLLVVHQRIYCFCSSSCWL